MRFIHLFLVVAFVSCAGSGGASPPPPNVVLILADDLGYGDLGCYGAKDIRTPNLDRMAAEGVRFTDFYAAQAVCTASRAALLTGCYPNRVGLQGALNHTSTIGINPHELLLSEACKQRGYATAIYGKWHLGHRPPFLPTRHGFDEFLGIPYSNDNGPLHPTIRGIPSLPLYEGEKIVATDPDQSQFTRMFTERSVDFIRRNRDRPFFLYVPHVMPHVPIAASKAFKGKSGRGLYGDVVEELDWSVGEILGAIRACGLDSRTLVIFLSDNGPFLSYGNHAGSPGPLREGKLTTFEGGVRVPCIMRWPGRVHEGWESLEPMAALDFFPTIAPVLARPMDGRDMWPWLGGTPPTMLRPIFFYAGDELQAVRQGDWKLHFPHDYLSPAQPPGRDGKPANFENMKPQSIELSGIRGIASRHGYVVKQIGLSLFNLREDPGESRDVAADHPDIVKELQALAETARADLGDSLTGRKGAGVRPPGTSAK
jgi:arylsulfatase